MLERVRVLGTVEIEHDGVSALVRGDLPRALLTRLALTPGETVSADQLIADVWPTPSDSVLSTLRAHLSRLRSAGLDTALVGSRSGYRLDLDRSRVDVAALLDAASAPDSGGEDEARLAALAALALEFDRELAGGLQGAPFLGPVRARLAVVRRGVEERLGELALGLGDETLAAAVLEGTVSRNPEHEKPARLLATALARQSRLVDAVTVLDEFVRSSAADPSPAVAALRTSIARLEPAVLAPSTSNGTAVVRHAVQIPLTRFIGRADTLAALREARSRERLITLVGPAGVGKTRTAVEIAREATTAVDDEQFMIDLAEVREPSAVLQMIAATVRATEPTVEAVSRRLSGRRVLLILDNADHVLGALAIAASGLLAAVTSVRLLVTSREPLRLAEEHEIVLAPFDATASDDAWRLLVERASDARGGEPFDATEEQSARLLCEELDGIPLALELAASRLDILDVDAVRAGLVGWAADGRHGSVASAIAWSFDLLSPYLKRALVHASRFAGPFTVEAFAGVEDMDENETAAVLRDLVGKSLLAPERSETGRPRLRMLESMREFAATVDDGTDVDTWAARHRRWFARAVWAAAPSLRSFEARDTMAMLDGFRADIDAAQDGSEVAGDRLSGLLLAAGLAPYWHLRGRFAEGRTRIVHALAIPETPPARAGSSSLPPSDEDSAALRLAIPTAELELANLAYQLGDAETGFAAIAAAQEHGQAADDATTTAVALARAAYGYSMFGQVDTADALITTASVLAADAPEWAATEVLFCRGQMQRARGRATEARRILEEADSRASAIGYIWMITSARYVLAKTLIDLRLAREAIGVARDAIRWSTAHEDAPAGLALLHTIAGACAFVERHAIGARLLGAVDALGVRYGYSTAAVEGEEAERLRRAVSSGLTVPEFDLEYATGRSLDWDTVLRLVDTLPRTDPQAAHMRRETDRAEAAAAGGR